jgi:hypothetical protein
MTVIPTFAQSVPLHDNHIGTVMNPEQDCLHYCMPGVPQVRDSSVLKTVQYSTLIVGGNPKPRL